MIPEEFSGGGVQRNVLGGPLGACGERPLTGFFRDGCCNTSDDDLGRHTVCAVMTAEFLEFSKAAGNDLSTPRPEFGFPRLPPGCRLVTAGACVLRAGAKPGRPVPHPACSSTPPTRQPSISSLWKR